jgi:ribonuclease P/MRP protein subunit POP7
MLVEVVGDVYQKGYGTVPEDRGADAGVNIRFGAKAQHSFRRSPSHVNSRRASFYACTKTIYLQYTRRVTNTNRAMDSSNHTAKQAAQSQRTKMPRLPKGTLPSQINQDTTNLTSNTTDASITKRPLLRPAIVSPYASSSAQKVVYISTRTPFMSAVKRVEKLLRLADKRDVQTATTHAQKNKRKRRRDDDGAEDEVVAVARGVEEERERKRRAGGVSGEEVLVKGTGKAVSKVMEVGAWFLQRESEFVVRIRTGSVGAVDDVEVPEGPEGGDEDGGEKMDVDQAQSGAESEKPTMDGDDAAGKEKEAEAVSGARVRYLSVLEVTVSLR